MCRLHWALWSTCHQNYWCFISEVTLNLSIVTFFFASSTPTTHFNAYFVIRLFNYLIWDTLNFLLDNGIREFSPQKRCEAPDGVFKVCNSLISGWCPHQPLFLCDSHHCPAARQAIDVAHTDDLISLAYGFFLSLYSLLTISTPPCLAMATWQLW